MLLKHMFAMQQNTGRIATIHPVQINLRIDEEIESLKRLKRRSPCYLNQYDQLFRLMTVWLLGHGYDLTNHQPHQVLKDICLLNCPQLPIEQMIQQRHQLKKQFVADPSTSSIQALQQCLNFFNTALQAYVSSRSEQKQAQYFVNN